jgi:hypothetical protein
MQPPKETEAPALPHFVVAIVKENASAQSFITLPTIRDKVIELVQERYPDTPWQPDTEDRRRLYIRIRHCMQTAQLLDTKIKVKEALTTSRTKFFKVYYHV